MSTALPHALIVNATKIYPPREIARLSEHATITVLTNPEYAHRYVGMDVRLVDTLYDFGPVQRIAREVYEERGIDWVIGPAERSVPASGLIRSWFGIPGTPFDTALRCSNKHLMKQALRATGLPTADWSTVPTVAQVPDALDTLGVLPVVVKPVFGGGGQNTFVLRSREEAVALATSPEAAGLRESGFPVIVERFVRIEDEYHCDGVVYDGKVEFAGVSRYLVPPLQERADAVAGSISVDPDAPEYGEIQELHRRTIEALGLDAGVTHLEVLATDEGFLIGEIACRPGGDGVTDLVRLQHGVDLWQAFTDAATGRAPRIEQVTDPHTVILVDLPFRAGRVVAVSDQEELAVLPGVVQAEVFVSVGDVIEKVVPGAAASRVYIAAENTADALHRAEELMKGFVLEVAPHVP
jgi:biotin carboxylase